MTFRVFSKVIRRKMNSLFFLSEAVRRLELTKVQAMSGKDLSVSKVVGRE